MRLFDHGTPDEGVQDASERVLTVPNAVTLARVLALPFIWMALTGHHWWLALGLVAGFSATDWIDGYLARRLGQVSRFGMLFDPLADRALFATVSVGTAVSGLLPWWSVIALVGRDGLVLIVAGFVVVRGRQPPPVRRLGKAATFGLMVAFPTFIGLAALYGTLEQAPGWLRAGAWAVFIASLVAYWVSAFAYAVDLATDGQKG